MSRLQLTHHRKSIDQRTIRDFWLAAMRHKLLLLQASTHIISVICTGTLAPLLIGKSLAALSNSPSTATHYMTWFAAIAIIGFITNRYGFAKILTHQARVISDLQELSLQTLLKRSVGFHNNNISGKLVSDALDYPAAYASLGGAFFIETLPFVIIMVTGTTIIAFSSWPLAVGLVLMTVITIGSAVRERQRRSDLRIRRHKATKELTGHMADTIVNSPTVKTFASEEAEMQRHRKLNRTLLDIRTHDWQLVAQDGSKRILALMAAQFFFVLGTIYLVQRDPQLLAIGIFAFSLTVTLSNRLFEVNTVLRNIDDALLQAMPMTEILMGTPEIIDNENADELTVTSGAISLQNVHFRYHDGDNGQTVFDGLRLDIQPGEKIGLVGPSGGGKSTFTRLLLRFDDIDTGSISIDGQNIAEVTQASLRQAISYVPQEPLLFHRSIRENITYGKADATDEEVITAARKANAHEFIEKLPLGYDTIVGERGVKLSGGQRQRVAIARAMLKNAPILILDEATSALDSESEVLIQEALWELMKDCTAIVIAHRLSTIQKMDRIIVLDNGKIVEEGTHKALLDQKGLYAKLWSHQSGGFVVED